MASVVTPERFASGMTFDEYVAYICTPENLAREGSAVQGSGTTTPQPRRDYSDFFRQAYEATRLTDDQLAALKWIASQPNAPAKMLAISEDWSSDCRRDVPTFARIAEALGAELRVFRRDGQKFSAASVPSIAEAPDSNADIMAEFLNHKNGQTWQSIPVCVFYDKDLNYLYHYTEFPQIYEKDRVVQGHIRSPRPGETPQQTSERSNREFGELVGSPFWRIWTTAAVNEIVSALHRKAVLGAA